MSLAPSPLPAGWSKILDEVQMRLDHAITAADARVESMPQFDTARLTEEKHQEIAKWSDRLQRLTAFLESAEQVVHSVDEMLQKEETLLRHHLAASGTLRQKLAEEAGRAIV